jgi:hypothetical protein
MGGVLSLSDIGMVWWSDRIMRSPIFWGHDDGVQ